MKSITTIKGLEVKNTNKEFLSLGVVSFQLVTFIVNFYGTKIETTHDTKIMNDGSQIVIGGCGYIPDGYKLQ
jgi:hypothetical protein